MSHPCPQPDIAQVVATARAHAQPWVSYEHRRAALEQLRSLVLDHRSELVAALASDLGSSTREAELSEIAPVLAEITTLLRALRRTQRTSSLRLPLWLWPARAHLQRQPLGAVLIIAPWNYPVNLTLGPLAGVLAAGNSAVIKPAEEASATASLLATLIPRYFPAGEVQVVTGSVSCATALLEHRWDHIIFTGSGRVGRIVAAAAAKHLTPVTLELGGKSPVWVDDSVNIRDAAQRIVWAKFFHAGQTCVAPDYVLVPAALHDDLISELSAAIHRLYGPDPLNHREYPPLIHDRAWQRLSQLIDSSTVVAGGHRDRQRRKISPTIIDASGWNYRLGPESNLPVMETEIFGPLLPVIPLPGDEPQLQAVDIINAWDAPLALYVASTDRRTFGIFSSLTRSGAVVRHGALIHAGLPQLPFGGIGASGSGRYHGRYSLAQFSHDKPIMELSPRWNPFLLVSPSAPQWLSRVISWFMTRF